MQYEKKIIIFDDDENVLLVCTTILEKQGWQVFTFTDCRDVVKKVTEINPTVIFMDNWIPDTGGIIATQLLKNTPGIEHIPIVYFSANDEIKSLATEAGADAYLPKPFNVYNLAELVDNAVQHKII